MKTPTKAALLSALVFPGAGHIYLKKYIPGIALIIIVCASLYYVVSSLLHEAMQIAGQIINGKIQPDAGTITRLVAQQSSGPQAQIMNAATTLIAMCWLIGIIDSYRLGRAKQKSETGAITDEKNPVK